MRFALCFMVSLVSGASLGMVVEGVAPAAATKAGQHALDYVRAQRSRLALSQADVSDVVVASEQDSDDGAAIEVSLRQRHRGIEVTDATIVVSVAPDGRVLGHSGDFVSNLARTVNRSNPVLSPIAALQAAATHLGLRATHPLAVAPLSGPARETQLSGGGFAAGPMAAKLVYHRTAGSQLRLAWVIEIEERFELHWWVIAVDAASGDILHKFDRVVVSP